MMHIMPHLSFSVFLVFAFLLVSPTAAAAWSRTGWSVRRLARGSSNKRSCCFPAGDFHNNRGRIPSSSSTAVSSSSSSSSSNSNHPNLLLNYNITSLHNSTTVCTFYALRHGQSLANQAGIIASNPDTAREQYGLSATGLEQAAAAGHAILAEILQQTQRQQQQQQQQQYYCIQQVQLVSSDLLRAVETAEMVRQTLLEETADNNNTTLPNDRIHLQIPPIALDTRLRERDFGTWDGTSDQNYHQVWKDDAVDASHTVGGVESVHAVMRRATACVLDWANAACCSSNNKNNKTMIVVLVAHGDVLQILQTAFLKRDGRHHRSVEHLETAQLRKLELQ